MGHRLKQDYPAAISAYREATEKWRSLSSESVDVSIGLNAIAGVEKESGDLSAAEQDFREALRIARAVGYAEGVATFTGNLAALALHRKDWSGAESLARESLYSSEKVGRQELVAGDYCRLAEALVRQGKVAEALPFARRAVDIFTKLGSPHIAHALETRRECEAAAPK